MEVKIYRTKYHIYDHKAGSKTEQGYRYSLCPIAPAAVLIDAGRTEYRAGSSTADGVRESEDYAWIVLPEGYHAVTTPLGTSLVTATMPGVGFSLEELFARGLKRS